MPTLRKKNLYVVSVQHLQLVEEPKTARNTDKNLLNLIASFVVQFHSGSAGEILISANHVTRSSAVETTYRGKQKNNYLNVQKERNAHYRLSILPTEKNTR